jgi:hypothetical protein
MLFRRVGHSVMAEVFRNARLDGWRRACHGLVLAILQAEERMAMYWAIVILAATSLAAQTADAQDRPGREQVLKVSGCITQASRTGSLTDDTGAGNVPSPSTAGVEANSSEPVNAYMLVDATPPAGGGVQREAGERTSYALEGLASELANHKGHRVEIVGQLLPRLPAVSGPKSPAAAIQRIAVQTVKMVSAQCESRHTR